MQVTALQRSNRLRGAFDAILSEARAPDDRRATIAAASHSVTFQHHHAIAILIESGLYGSAAALLRPMYEACVNGLWLTYVADDQHLQAFEENRYRPEPSKALRKLRSHDDGEYIQCLERMHKQVVEPLNSYVHTGGLQVMRHIGASFIGPNFDEDEVGEYLGLANTILIASTLELPSLLGLQADQRVHEAILEYKPTHA